MEGAEEEKTRKRQQPVNRVVLRAGGGGGLLLLGGALAAAAALGVAFIVRAAAKKKKTKQTLHEAEQEKEEKKPSISEGRGKEGEDRGGFCFLPPPPHPASPPSRPPPPPPTPPAELPNLVAQGEGDSSFKHEQTRIDVNATAFSESEDDDLSEVVNVEDVIVEEPNLIQVQEKIIEENTSIGGEQDEEEEEGEEEEEEEEEVLPTGIINKDVVIDESKIIQVVEEVPLEKTTSIDSFAREGEEEKEEEEEKSPVKECGAEESLDETGSSSMGEPEAAEVIIWPAKAIEPTLASLGIRDSKNTTMTLVEEDFHGHGEKVGTEEAGMGPWEENRAGALERMLIEMKETSFSKNAQVLLLVSTLLFTTLLAIWFHHCSINVLESSHP